MAKLTQKARYVNTAGQPLFNEWVKAQHGTPPTEGQLLAAGMFSRAGGKQALGIAMALRDEGMTSAQMTNASALFDGRATTCRNKIKAQIAAGMFTGGASNGTIKITLTPKGQQYVDRQLAHAKAGDAEPAPGKAVTKSVKRNAKKAARKARPAPVSEAPVTLTEQVPAGAGDGTGEPAQA